MQETIVLQTRRNTSNQASNTNGVRRGDTDVENRLVDKAREAESEDNLRK